MKNILRLKALVILSIFMTSCTVESLDDTFTVPASINLETSAVQTCSNQNPQSRLVNNGTLPFTFTIIDSNNNTSQIQSIAPGTTSTYISFNDGVTMFSVEANTTGTSDDKLVLDMDTCTQVDIVINAQNVYETPIIEGLD